MMETVTIGNRGRNKSSAKSYAKVERTVNPRREPA